LDQNNHRGRSLSEEETGQILETDSYKYLGIVIEEREKYPWENKRRR